ncbi:nuclear transport factor 2 family protein [Streptomyces sp. NPDC058579]|uniref:nuclear transport factor 2 family protein n=1 Tax=Streptomyces sp. NPDC058579 TaxID=3346548 RepID=UPI00364734EF
MRLAADDWARGTAPRMESFRATQHMITNLRISFDGENQATCVAYVRASHHLPTAPVTATKRCTGTARTTSSGPRTAGGSPGSS